MVATKGMLSTTAETMAETQRMRMAVAAKSPSVQATMWWARISSAPAFSMPATTTNRPTKKKMVTHSTSPKLRCTSWDCSSEPRPTTRMSSNRAAPNMAMVPGSWPRGCATTKPAMTSRMTNKAWRSNRMSVMAARASKPITWRRSSSLAVSLRPQNHQNPARVRARMIPATGARLTRKALKESLAAEPIMMLGGSPMRVAVPPMLEAKMMANR